MSDSTFCIFGKSGVGSRCIGFTGGGRSGSVGFNKYAPRCVGFAREFGLEITTRCLRGKLKCYQDKQSNPYNSWDGVPGGKIAYKKTRYISSSS